MKVFTKEQIELLKPYEQYFRTVVKAKYKRATSSHVNDIVANIYEDTTGEILQRNWNCPHCTFEIFKKCGELYYRSLEYYTAEESGKTEQKKVKTEQNETEQPKRSNKVGRPRKDTKSNNSVNNTRKKKDTK